MISFANLRSVARVSLRALAVAMSLTVLSHGASAQEQTSPQPATTAAPITLQTVVVTGTLIARPAAETAEAITVLKADAIKNQGIVNVEQALNTVTSNVPSVNISSSVGTFDGGGTYANLRNLGNGRTLVLLDGQRLANNAFTGNAVDLSGIPFSAIESVQVLREGASALYGSDAIAGVINFITKRNYQGLEIQTNFDHPQQAGGSSFEGDVTFGHGDLVSDGYNFMITASYTKSDELKASQRSFSASGFDPPRGVFNTNDPGTWPASVIDSNGNYWQPGYPACAGNSELTTALGNCAYRYSAATDLLPESKEGSVLASFTKALPGSNQVQLQLFDARSDVADWSGPMFYEFVMDPKSPYFPTASELTVCETCSGAVHVGPNLTGTPNPVLAVWTDPNNNRYVGNINTEQRALLTFSGTNGGWHYETLVNYSENKNDNRNISGIPDEAVLAPGGVVSDLINPFGPQTAAGQALINSSYVAGVYEIGADKRWSVDAHADHDLGDAFNAGTPARVALGVSVGGEHFDNETTPYNNLVIAATGLQNNAVEGARRTQAIFAELDVPMTKHLDVDVSDREDRYSDFGTTNNGKVSVRYQPARFLTFRGAASTGFRAPTLRDLYLPDFLTASTSGNMGVGNPDCNPPTGGVWTAATCASQGLELNGGNPKLTPETSQNFDLGIVLAPVRNLGITLDYYRILLKNTIGGVPAQAIYSDPSAFASYYVINSSGTLTSSVAEPLECPTYAAPTCGYVLATASNTGRITTDGVDVSIQYLQHTPIGTFREDLEGTAVTQLVLQQYTGGPNLNLVGWYNSGNKPAYRWQHNLRIDWSSPQGSWGGGLSNRYYSSYIDEFPDGNGNQRIVGSYSTWDGYVSLKPIPQLTVLFGIKNILDKNPPFTNAAQDNFAAGYNALVVDPLMRNFYVNVKYDVF